MSELYVDSLPTMETEDTFALPGQQVLNPPADSVAAAADGSTPSLDSSIEVPKLLAEIVKPPTPPPEPVLTPLSVSALSSSLSSLQQSLINEIKNKHQATTSDLDEEASEPVLLGSAPSSQSETLVNHLSDGGVSLNRLSVEEESPDEPNRERPLIVHCKAKNSGPVSASNSDMNPHQSNHPANTAAPEPPEDLAPLRLSANYEQPSQIIGGWAVGQHQQFPSEGQTVSNGEQNENAVCGFSSSSARNGSMVVLGEMEVSSTTSAGEFISSGKNGTVNNGGDKRNTAQDNSPSCPISKDDNVLLLIVYDEKF